MMACARPSKMTTRSGLHPIRANKLRQFSVYLMSILATLTVAECSLTEVLHSTAHSAAHSAVHSTAHHLTEHLIDHLAEEGPGALIQGHGENQGSPIMAPTPVMVKSSENLAPPNWKPLNSSPAEAAAETLDASSLGLNKGAFGEEDKQNENLFQKLGGMVKNAIAPTKSYVDLVHRYHKWFFNYKKLQSLSKRRLQDPNEVLKEEYSKVDEQLMHKEMSKHLATEEPMDPKEAENMDFVFRALKIVIEHLEEKLERLEERENIPIDEEDVSASEAEPVMRNATRVQEAMDRVKRTVMNSAKNLLSGEMAIIARTAVFHGLAQFMDAKPDTGDALDHLRPIISLLGSASTPILVSYFSSIQFRAALAVVDQANPLSLLKLNRKSP